MSMLAALGLGCALRASMAERELVRVEREAQSAAATQGLRCQAWRVGKRVRARLSAPLPLEVWVAVKEWGGPWSPQQARHTLTPGEPLELEFPGAIGERLVVLEGQAPDLPPGWWFDQDLEETPHVLAVRPLEEGRLVPAEGWEPDRPWLLVFRGSARQQLASAVLPPHELVGRLNDSSLSEPDRLAGVLLSRGAVSVEVGPGRPLKLRAGAGGRGLRGEVPGLWIALRHEGEGWRPAELTLLAQ